MIFSAVALATLLLAQALPAADPVPSDQADRLIACAGTTMQADEIRRLTAAMLARSNDPGVNVSAMISRVADRCIAAGQDRQTLALGAIIYVMAGEGREAIATQLALSGDDRIRFDGILQPFANRLIGGSGAGPFATLVSNEAVADMRMALRAAGFTLSISDDNLKGYAEALARDRLVADTLRRMLAERP